MTTNAARPAIELYSITEFLSRVIFIRYYIITYRHYAI